MASGGSVAAAETALRQLSLAGGDAPVVGTCMDMCPLEERLRRQEQNRLDPCERVQGSGNLARKIPPSVDHAKAVKEYSRPAAGQAKPTPSDLRPAPVLRRTAHYLVHTVAAEAWRNSRLAHVYAFVADRLRAVRQDMVIQQISGADAASILEPAARFLLFATYQLRTASLDHFEPVLHRQQLKETLLSLTFHYNRLRPTIQPNEPLFQAALLAAYHDHSEVLRSAVRLPTEVLQSAPMQLAFKAVAAIHTNLFHQYFRLCRTAPPLLACCLSVHAHGLRRAALEAMVSGFASATATVPLADLAQMLALKDASSAASLCQLYGIAVEGTNALFRRGGFAAPVAVVPPELLATASFVPAAETRDAAGLEAILGRKELAASPGLQPNLSLAHVLKVAADPAALVSFLDRPPKLPEQQQALTELIHALIQASTDVSLVVTFVTAVCERSEPGWREFRMHFLNHLQKQHEDIMKQKIKALPAVLHHLHLLIGIVKRVSQRVFCMAFALLVEQLLVTRGDVTDDDRRAVLAVVITVVDSATAEELWPKFLRNIIDQMSTGSPELEAQKQRIRDRLARIGI